MDGLDEVATKKKRHETLNNFKKIVNRYPNNNYILTCRHQVIEYSSDIPIGFDLVEIAPFSENQVECFVKKWFVSNGESEQLAKKQYQYFKDSIDNNPALKELTVTPLLLSLICLVLHDEGEIPYNKADLYQKGIKLMLDKWNNSKGIVKWKSGNKIYRELSIESKEKLLMKIAVDKSTNHDSSILFKEKELARLTAKILNLEKVSDGLGVIKALEVQHGLLIKRADELWSFSHLTFQEYFTSQWLCETSLENLLEHLLIQRWQEVIKNLVDSQKPAHQLLMRIKLAIDMSISKEKKLQKFLTWVFNKSNCCNDILKTLDMRTFYCTLNRFRGKRKEYGYKFDHILRQSNELSLDNSLAHAFDFDFDLYKHFDNNFYRRTNEFSNARKRAQNVAIKKAYKLQPELAKKLTEIWKTPPKLDFCDASVFKQWWKLYGEKWFQELRQTMIEHRDICHDWSLTEEEQKLLEKYYLSINFLIEIINIDDVISKKFRSDIEDSIFLPWKELQSLHSSIYS